MSEIELRCGFRYDPMEWVENSGSFEAAVLRQEVLDCPKPGDAERIRRHIDDALPEAMQRAAQGQTPGGECWLICEAAMPETKKLAEALLAARREQGEELGLYELQDLGPAGMVDDPLVQRSVQSLVARVMAEKPWHCCQWGPFEKLQALAAFEGIDGVGEAIDHLTSAIDENINVAGFTGKGKIPYGQVFMVRYMDHPGARRMLGKTIPFILCAQNPGGGWGGDTWTFGVVQSLKKAGLFDELRNAPPKPADWRIVRTIPAPEGSLRGLTWDGERFWVKEQEGNCAIALSPQDGRVLRTIELPGERVSAIGWWHGKLHAAQWEPEKLLVTLDPETGEAESSFPLTGMEACCAVGLVDGEIWAVDNYDFWLIRHHADGSGRIGGFCHPSGNTPNCLTVLEGSVWHSERCGPVMLRTGLDGTLLDFASAPFPEDFLGLDGLAWDGDHLWALHGETNRICQIERTEEGKAFAQHFISGGE